MSRPEVGLATVELTAAGLRDPIFADLGQAIETFQWHGAEVTKLPEGAEVLAMNAACPIQAIRWGRHAFGFQYHCEITETTAADWRAIPAYAKSLEEALGAIEAAGLQEVVAPKLKAFRQAARQLNVNFLSLIQ
jgi:GMP synthase-like glutamine amidotransferase